MKDRYEIYKKCNKKLADIGIQTGNVKDVVVNNRTVTRWGQCRWKGSEYTIEINGKLLEDDAPDEAVESTMIHELLHTCKNCGNHGREWKRLAGIVNEAYGYNIKRTDSADDKGGIDLKASKAKHKVICEKCGVIIYRTRDCNLTKYTNHYRCSCGGTLKLEY